MKVLIAVEHIASETEIVRFIQATGWLESADIHVLTVISPLVFVEPTLGAAAVYTTFWQDAQERAESLMLSTVAQLQSQCGREIKWQIAIGDPASEILACATREQADLIVVATSSPQGVLKLFRGSVSQTVAAHAPCSTLVLKLSHDKPE